jgi:predicted extracellular nuclease
MRLILIAIFVFISFSGRIFSQWANELDSFYVASWNVENLFDTKDDPAINDSDFLPVSELVWTEDKFEQKLVNLARVINFMNNGCGPDILGLQEVENLDVLKFLIYKFKDRDYIIAHRDSPDERGIDAALIYDRKIFNIFSVDTIRVNLPTGYNTRYILNVALSHKKSNEIVRLFVNHWPSRRGGDKKSEPNRWAAAMTLRSVVDSLVLKNPKENLILLGDFNDEPANSSIEKILGAKKYECGKLLEPCTFLYNLAYREFMSNNGSYLFGSDWKMLDQIIVSNNLLDGKKADFLCGSFEVIKPQFMVTKTGNKKGGPFATYAGKKYLGGYSDHFPVGAKFILLKEK